MGLGFGGGFGVKDAMGVSRIPLRFMRATMYRINRSLHFKIYKTVGVNTNVGPF